MYTDFKFRQFAKFRFILSFIDKCKCGFPTRAAAGRPPNAKDNCCENVHNEYEKFSAVFLEKYIYQ